MGELKLQFEVKKSIGRTLLSIAKSYVSGRARGTFADLRPFINEAIVEGIKARAHDFQPNNGEAAELGIGAGGQIDRERVDEAWTELLPANGLTTFSVTNSPKGGRIRITVDEKGFFAAPLCNIPTPDSDEIDNIPWMDWFINGAPTNTAYRFQSKFNRNIAVSRTGKGIMVKGGTWSFPPSRFGAIRAVEESIQIHVTDVVNERIGKVVF